MNGSQNLPEGVGINCRAGKGSRRQDAALSSGLLLFGFKFGLKFALDLFGGLAL